MIKHQTNKHDSVPPASKEAIKLGCTCPVLDNSRGQGYMKLGMYWANDSCPVHNMSLINKE